MIPSNRLSTATTQKRFRLREIIQKVPEISAQNSDPKAEGVKWNLTKDGTEFLPNIRIGNEGVSIDIFRFAKQKNDASGVEVPEIFLVTDNPQTALFFESLLNLVSARPWIKS